MDRPRRRAPDLTRRRFLRARPWSGSRPSWRRAAARRRRQPRAPRRPCIPTAPPVSPTRRRARGGTPLPSPTGPLKFANWPAYIDLTGTAGDNGEYAAGSSPTHRAVQEEVRRRGRLRGEDRGQQDLLRHDPAAAPGRLGRPAGTSIVITDWLAAKVISKGWAEQIDHADVPELRVANLRRLPSRTRSWDPNNDFHYPWQSGMTGIGFNTKTLQSAGIAAPKSLKDLWAIQPDKVTFLTESRDTFGLGPAQARQGRRSGDHDDRDDLQAVHDDIKPLVDKGLRLHRQRVPPELRARRRPGRRWSGPATSPRRAPRTTRSPVPDEGVMIWTDNMVIPKGAVNKYTAELMMNFVYDPEIAAQIEDYVYYVSPVKGADDEIKALDPGAETNPLHLPDRRTSWRSSTTSSSCRTTSRRSSDELYLDADRRLSREPADRAMTAIAALGRAPGIRRRRLIALGPYLLLAPGLLWLLVLLRLPGGPDVPDVDLDRHARQRLHDHRHAEAVHRRARRSSASSSATRSCTAAISTVARLPDRLPGRLHDRVPRRPLQEPAAVPRHRPVLHELPDPDHQLEDPARRRGADPRRPQARRRHPAGRLLASSYTPVAVRSPGITYNFLPFMILPLYVALEKIDIRLHRGGRGPVRQPAGSVPPGHPAAGAAGRLRRVAS